MITHYVLLFSCLSIVVSSQFWHLSENELECRNCRNNVTRRNSAWSSGKLRRKNPPAKCIPPPEKDKSLWTTIWDKVTGIFERYSYASGQAQRGRGQYPTMGSVLPDHHLHQPPLVRRSPALQSSAIPDEFDARKKWPNCPTIGEIFDQGCCLSCWAVAPTSVMSDRICIASNAKLRVRLSAEDVLSCCGEACGCGCRGGYPSVVWNYWQQFGIVTGGRYGSAGADRGCKPYSIPHTCPKGVDAVPEPACDRSCVPEYRLPYTKDKRLGDLSYTIRGEDNIKREIMSNGPVEGYIQLYDDFSRYTSGVYQYTGFGAGEYRGAHTFKIIGWGFDAEVKLPYWLCANAYGTAWGENGFFRIKRGTNELGIESNVTAGKPIKPYR